jgi:hypothetical protein
MQDATDSQAPRAPDPPIVLTAEEIFLFVHGGSPANDLPRETRAAMSIDELIDHGQRAKRNHLTHEKIAVLEAQLADPNSWVNRALQMMQERIDHVDRVDWFQALSNPTRKKLGQPLYKPDQPLKRGDPQVATARELIVRFIRDAAGRSELPEDVAVRILAEAGESLAWMDSVPDRLIMSEPMAPVRGTPTEKRKYLATYYPVLADLMTEQNVHMYQRLAEASPDLSEKLQRQLAESEGRGDPGTPRSGR